VDLGARPGADLPGQRPGRAFQADGHLDQSRRIHPAVGVVLDRGRQPGRGPQDADYGQVPEHQVPAVDQAGHARDADADQPARRLGQRQRGRGHLVIVGAVDDRVVGRPGWLAGRQVGRGPKRQRELATAAVDGQHVHLGPRGHGEGHRQQSDRARSAHQDPLPGTGAGRRRGPPGVASGFDQGPGPVVEGVRQPVQA